MTALATLRMNRYRYNAGLCLVFAVVGIFPCARAYPCQQRATSHGFVCVCNATYCDSLPPLSLSARLATIVESGEKIGVMRQAKVAFNQSIPTDGKAVITISITRYQTLLGFGGAFTDAASLNILSLSAAAQERLIASYYSKTGGIGYTLGRVPMASCDFSTHEYSYDDHAGDFALLNFSLAAEDVKMKIPLIQLANTLAGKPMKLFGSPWSAPGWLKTNGKMTGRGSLQGNAGDKYHKTWAMYFVRFLQEYSKHNLTFWGLTAQNEPADGDIPGFSFQCMYFSAAMERDFIKMDLGPALEDHGFQNVNLMIMDDQRVFLPGFAKTVLSDPEAAKYVSGVAVHWYIDGLISSDVLTKTHNSFPEHFILSTEACEELVVLLGSWDRGQSYAHDIIQDLNNWVVGWTDWNIALNLTGGPNWANNFVDSPIIVAASKDEFYKQPMFYALAHFSAFIAPGSVRIQADLVEPPLTLRPLDSVSFLTPYSTHEDVITTVILNKHDDEQTVVIHDPAVGSIEHVMQPNSIATVQYLRPA